MTSTEDLIAAAYADPEMAALVSANDWYLVGSRARGFNDDLSDWDTMLLTRDDPTDAERAIVGRRRLDRVFGTHRPTDEVMGTLSHHRAWRRTRAVDVSVFGPAGRAHRDGDGDMIWAYDLRNAIVLHLGGGPGEDYRRQVGDAFRRRCATVRDGAYLRFRMSRNETAATLTRIDPVALAMTSARCVRQAARFWLLAGGEPYPSDKWLLTALHADPTAAELPPLIGTVVDASAIPDARFEALWSLWQLVDARAVQVGVSADLLSGSPFTDPIASNPISSSSSDSARLRG